MFTMRIYTFALLLLLLAGCSTTYTNQQVTNKTFPEVKGQNLEKQAVIIPSDFKGKKTLLLLGYKQQSQFDIDRWLIALDMTNTIIDVYEIPTIQGLFPRMFSTMIDNAMRKGIPKDLWKGVITVYEDGEKIQAFTGNEKPNNARVLLLDKTGQIKYFYDNGFSVAALKALRSTIKSLN
jgi:hypothetical protein